MDAPPPDILEGFLVQECQNYRNRWFLFGYNPEKEKYDWNLAIDRIISFKEMQHPFLENTIIDWNEYFDDIIGVTKPAPNTQKRSQFTVLKNLSG